MHGTEAWRHNHVFDSGNPAAERSARRVMWITLVMMVLEIVAGLAFNSMALLADGWHMATHAFAIGLAAFAYAMARRFAGDRRFAFGTWKIEILASFTSALFLLAVAAAMVYESVAHLLSPVPIRFTEAMLVAALGLAVNVACALILGNAHDHDHGHPHAHEGAAAHAHDLNLRSAYMHVIADAATSVLAIAALAGGAWLGWNWLDPLMGIVGAILIAIWARALMLDAGKVLLDSEMDHPVVREIREAIEAYPPWSASTRIADLHVWRVGRSRFAVIVGLVTHDTGISPADVRAQLAQHEELAHVSVEINYCPCASGEESTPAASPVKV